MVYTHDKYGKPIPPQVLDILNMPVPLKPRKKRTASMVTCRSSPAPTQRSKLISLGEKVPHITEVPDLCSRSLRKRPSLRVPCENPLESTSETESESASIASTESETDSIKSTESETDSTDTNRISPIAWLKSMLESVTAVRDKTEIVKKMIESEKDQGPVHNDSPEWSGCKVLETFKITQKPGNTATRTPRMNSDFYRILALENAMCTKGKLGHPSVSMLIEPRSPNEPQLVLGIQQTLPRRRERRWRELSEADFI